MMINNTRILLTLLLGIVLHSNILPQITGLSGWNIYIDPGHSQTENMGVNGYSEAEEVLRVGLQLRDLLLTQTDIDTVYISRTNDQQSVSLYQRTSQANSLGAQWFHSIHSNAGAPNHNNTLLLWGQLYDGTPDPPVGGEDVSAIMIDILTRGMRIPTIGSRGDCSFYSYTGACSQSWPGPYLHVNRESNMPSELSEEGHHTNPTQNQLYMNTEYRRLLAYTFFWSILQYHEIDRPFVGIAAGIISDLESGIPINGARIFLNGQSYTTDNYESLFHNYSSDPDELHNGFYYFENLPNDTLEMVVEASGYYSDTSMIVLVDSFFTFHDVDLLSSAPPIVINTVPAEGDTFFPAWDPINIDFSRAMNSISVESAFSTDPPSTGTMSWNNFYSRLIYTPDSLHFVTDYILSISDSALDMYGHVLDGDNDSVPGGSFELHFRTSPSDITPPVIIRIYPPQTSNNIELRPIINVIYDEIVGPDSLFNEVFHLERFSTGVDVDGILESYIINNQTIFNFFPATDLNPQEVYITRIGPGLQDMFGNQLATWRSFSFQTGTIGVDITLIDDFENNLTSNWWVPQQSGSTTGIITDSTIMVPNSSVVNHLSSSTNAMEINYGWDENAGAWLIREYLASGSPRNVQFNSTYIMQAYVFGDGSGNLIRFCVDDNVPTSGAGNHEVSPWYEVDWIGWQLISWDMANDGTGTWIGDGNLDGTLRFDSIQFTYTPGNPIFGQFIIDDLRLVEEYQVNISEEVSWTPNEFRLIQNYPNPFNLQTTIGYFLPKEEYIQLSIYNLNGEQVRNIYAGLKNTGQHKVTWDGKNNSGQLVASGIYIYNLATKSESFSKRMLLIK